MRPKTTRNIQPPRMVARRRNRQSGAIWIGYYCSGRDEDGKRVELPLGTDLNEAKRKWAEYEGNPLPTDATLMQFVFDQYIRDIRLTQAPSTQRENSGSLRQLRESFDKRPSTRCPPRYRALTRRAHGEGTGESRGHAAVARLQHGA